MALGKQPIHTDAAPTPTGPFNQAVRIANLVFTSGQAGRNPETGRMGDIRDQTRRCIGNIEAILAAAGATLDDVVKVTVFLRSPDDAAAFNEEYRAMMPEPLPARSSAYAGLKNPDMLVEMDAVAALPERE